MAFLFSSTIQKNDHAFGSSQESPYSFIWIFSRLLGSQIPTQFCQCMCIKMEESYSIRIYVQISNKRSGKFFYSLNFKAIHYIILPQLPLNTGEFISRNIVFVNFIFKNFSYNITLAPSIFLIDMMERHVMSQDSSSEETQRIHQCKAKKKTENICGIQCV